MFDIQKSANEAKRWIALRGRLPQDADDERARLEERRAAELAKVLGVEDDDG